MSRHREFVWNLAHQSLAEAMNASSATVPATQDEFELAGLTATASKLVQRPGWRRARCSFECRLSQLVRLTDSKGVDTDTWLVLGEVVAIHISHALLRDGVYDTARRSPFCAVVARPTTSACIRIQNSRCGDRSNCLVERAHSPIGVHSICQFLGFAGTSGPRWGD